MASTFDRAMTLMRKRDPQLQEEGFALMQPIVVGCLPELLAAFDAETDQSLKGWLLELIGDARSESALPVLARELRSTDGALRGWAVRGLRLLDSAPARTALREQGIERE